MVNFLFYFIYFNFSTSYIIISQMAFSWSIFIFLNLFVLNFLLPMAFAWSIFLFFLNLFVLNFLHYYLANGLCWQLVCFDMIDGSHLIDLKKKMNGRLREINVSFILVWTWCVGTQMAIGSIPNALVTSFHPS